MHSFTCEGDVLRCFRRLIVQQDPDFIVAYNGVTFDAPFLVSRARDHAEASSIAEFFYQSRFALRPCRMREQKMTKAGRDDISEVECHLTQRCIACTCHSLHTLLQSFVALGDVVRRV